jgi:hypothetical protein
LAAAYRPSAAARLALAEWAAVAAADSPWPGWSLRQTPLALVVPLGGGVFVAGHDDPGPAATPVEAGPWEQSLGPVHWLPGAAGEGLSGPAVYPLALQGVPTLFAVSGGGATGLGPLLWSEGFKLHLRRTLGRHEPRLDVAYPLDDPAVSALATVEGRLLRDGGAAYAVALVRRERRGPLADDLVRYEQAVEVVAGLPAYVAHRVALALGGDPSAVLEGLEDLGTLSPRRRLEASGLGLALLLDREAPGWKEQVGQRTLDELLEAHVSFDGGEGDETTLAEAQARYRYPDLLAAARARADQAAAARRSLVEGILTGAGSLLTFNVAALGTAEVEAADPGESVNRSLTVYRGRVGFRYEAAELLFGDVPVAQDRRSGLLQARVPGRVRLSGDGRDLPADEAAEFTSGFQMDIRGVRVRARRGVLRPTDGGLYVELRP